MANPLRGQFEVELPDGSTIPALLNMHAVHLFLKEGNHKLTDLDILLNENHSPPSQHWHGLAFGHTTYSRTKTHVTWTV